VKGRPRGRGVFFLIFLFYRDGEAVSVCDNVRFFLPRSRIYV
jgi:hypothetical protein